MQTSLFKHNAPLAFRIRPTLPHEIIGQKHLISSNGTLLSWIEDNLPYSVIFWGPPGCGKTTIANVAKLTSNKEFLYLSGAGTSVAEIRDVIKKAKELPGDVVLFIDEIHRLAKNQQDVLLEPVEEGILVLIGSTTENPHISITRALHSRVKVLELKPLSLDELKELITRALKHPNGLKNIKITDSGMKLLISSASGDGRRLLFNLEEASKKAEKFNNYIVDENIIQNVIKDSKLQIGADGENYYNYVSALQKSIRGSNPDAALYWLGRLLAGGADPLHVARRILVTACEDIGLADNYAFTIATNAYIACQNLGMPEAKTPLAQAVIYLACAPKSNTTITSIDKAIKDAEELTPYPVPIHLRNIGGEGYKYPHAYKDAKVEQEYLPKELKDKKYFVPNERDKPC